MSFEKVSAIAASFFLNILFGLAILIFMFILFLDIIERNIWFVLSAGLINLIVLCMLYGLVYIPASIFGKNVPGKPVSECYLTLFPIACIPFLIMLICWIFAEPSPFGNISLFFMTDLYGVMASSLFVFLYSTTDHPTNTL
ncbi:MAG: hypothetical protein ACJ75J_18775 [Cytophagaceae bacterium]